MQLLLRRAAGQVLIPTALIAVGITLLLLLCVFRAEMATARQEGSRGYTPQALTVQAPPAEVARALESTTLDVHAYVEAGAGRRILALAPGATVSLPLHSGAVRPGGEPQALIGSQVDTQAPHGDDGDATDGAAASGSPLGAAPAAAAPAALPAAAPAASDPAGQAGTLIFEGRAYPVTGRLGSHERSLMQYETLIIDADRFAAAQAAVVVIDGPQARQLLEGPLAGARFEAQDQGAARRTATDTYSPVLLPLGGLAGALSLWVAVVLAVAARRQESRVAVTLGRTPTAVRLGTAARIAGMGALGAGTALLVVHLSAGLPEAGHTIAVLGAALGALTAVTAAGLITERALA